MEPVIMWKGREINMTPFSPTQRVVCLVAIVATAILIGGTKFLGLW